MAHVLSLTFLVELREPIQIPLEGSFVGREHRVDDGDAVWFHWVPLPLREDLLAYPTQARDLLRSLHEDVKHIVSKEPFGG